MKKYILMAALFLAAFIMTSCEGSYVVSSQPVRPAYERPISPGEGYVWIDGDWAWQGGTYVWHEGRWGRPRGGRTWVAGSWQQRNNGWTWHRGRWH